MDHFLERLNSFIICKFKSAGYFTFASLIIRTFTFLKFVKHVSIYNDSTLFHYYLSVIFERVLWWEHKVLAGD